jgi:sensor c-di-GMP phosphodiesterase-like protein
VPGLRTIAAFAFGAILAGLPLVIFNLWVGNFVIAQGRAQATRSAESTISLAEHRIGVASSALDNLALRGVASCRSDHLDVLRNANFSTSIVKEFSLIAPNGETLCSDLGIAPSQRPVLGTVRPPDRQNLTLELVQVGPRDQRFIRLRRPAISGPNAIAALIPPELLTHALIADLPSAAHIRMSLIDGFAVTDVGPPVLETESFVGVARSIPYGLTATAFYPRSENAEKFADLKTIGYLVAGLVALALFAFAVLLPRRSRENPVVALERAIRAGEFLPYFQPTIDITTGKVRGAEVLIRWRKPDGSIVPPSQFIPLAESTGLISEMTRQLMRKVRDEIGEAVIDRPFLRIGFNLSAQHFLNENIITDVRQIFEGSPLRLTQVVLEVTERQQLDDLTSARRVIAALQGLGVKIAIDDIGAGHSGLSYMLKLGVDIIKIDKMFIDALCHDDNSITIIETLIDLARNMRMDIIAEGVETFDQVVALRERGIRAAQGYVFSPPLPTASFLQLLDALDPVARTSYAAKPELLVAKRSA